jgi:chromate transporter
MKQNLAPSPADANAVPGDAPKHAVLDTPTVRDLFFGFLGLGFTSFGGALPLARRTVVERHRWLTAAEFTDLLGLCQFLPGGNVINLSVAIGMRFRGWRGALAGLLGLIAGPSLVVIGLGVLYERTQNDPHVRHLFVGLAAAAAGLLIAMAVKILLPLRRDPAAAIIALLGFIAIAVLRVPLLPTMLVLTPVGIVVAARAARRSGEMQ